MGLIFISHSSQDVEIAEFFVDSLKALGVDEDDIFFSAKTHMGVGVGNRFTEVINQKLHESTLVFLLLTNNYYASYNCQQEEGVAWYTMKEKKIYPIRIGVSFDDMKGFIDRTVIASEPHTASLRNIPYVLKELGFIDEIPEDIGQFDAFVKRCSECPGESIPDTMGQNAQDSPKMVFTDEDMILLNYFLENRLPLLIHERKTSNKKRTLEEYASDYPDFDCELQVKYFVKRSWIMMNMDNDFYLASNIFDMINSDVALKSRIHDVASRYRREKETLDSLILGGGLPDTVLMMLIYIWRNNVTELGDRWMAEDTINEIKYWENANKLDHILSDNYLSVLGYMKDKKWAYVKERTSYGNPRLYGISEDVISQLKSLSSGSVEHLKDVGSHYIQ